MNREDIIRMAREAGIEDWWDSGNEHREVLQEHLERFAALVASAEHKRVQQVYTDAATDSVKAAIAYEREACAKLCEQDDSMRWAGAANAIRARGQA